VLSLDGMGSDYSAHGLNSGAVVEPGEDGSWDGYYGHKSQKHDGSREQERRLEWEEPKTESWSNYRCNPKKVCDYPFG